MICNNFPTQLEFLARLADDDDEIFELVAMHGWKRVLCSFCPVWSLEELKESPDSVFALLCSEVTSLGLIPKKDQVPKYADPFDFHEDFMDVIYEMPRAVVPFHLHTVEDLEKMPRLKLAEAYAAVDMLDDPVAGLTKLKKCGII